MFGIPNSSSKRRFPLNGWLLFVLLGVMVVVLVLGQNSLWMAPAATETPASAALDPSTVEETSAENSDSSVEDVSPESANETAQVDEPFLPDYDSAFDAALTPETDDRPLWQVGLDLAVKLLIVIGLAYASLAGLRWLQKTKHLPKAGSQTIQILETVGLAPGKTLHLVVVGEKTLLLGATEQQLSLLSELSPVSATTPVTKEMLYEDENTPEPTVDDDASTTPFEAALYQQTMTRQTQQPSAQLEPMQPEMPSTAGEWQTVLDGMKTGVRHIQDMVGGGQSK